VPPERAPAVPPTWLPWVLDLAVRDAEIRAELARGDQAPEVPTAWFERHGWPPLSALPPEAPPDYAARVAARRQRTAANPALALIERPVYKRRWYRPDHAAQEAEALTAWLAARVEQCVRERQRPSTAAQVTAALQDDRRVLAVAELRAGRRDFDLGHLLAGALAANAVPGHPLHLYRATGLAKRAAWERTWDLQRREDAGEPVAPPVPPAYAPADFLRVEHFRLRGPLDVPKERFIALTEVPAASADALYGWAGWTPIERLRHLLALDEGLEDQGVPLADRVGLLDSAWRLLPDAAREDAARAARLRAELVALVGPAGPSPEMLAAWRERHPPPGARHRRADG
jgi:hypothetical protein